VSGEPWYHRPHGVAQHFEARDALVKELETTGVRAVGRVRFWKNIGFIDYQKGWRGVDRKMWWYALELDVQPPGGAPAFELRKVLLTHMDDPWVGSYVPLIYDPNDIANRIAVDETVEGERAAAKLNVDQMPADILQGRKQLIWSMARGEEMQARLSAIADRAERITQQTRASTDPAAKLEALAQHHASGALTDEQYAAARERILDQI
jgi:hypothetical protein